jgi:phage terminase large subunit GpA-like protein
VYGPGSGVPGPRDPNLTPYVIAFERFFSDDQYETCALITGTQQSKTDAILDVIGWRLDTRPRPQLYVGPSRDFVADVFEPRLMKLFDEAPRLAGLIARGKRNKKVRKIVNGAPIRLAWAGSATSLASDQAGDVYIDEYDKMVNGRIGTGDPFTLAKARADTYADRKICVTSTPERGRIEVEKCPDTGLEFWKVAPPADLESPIWIKWQTGTRHHWAWPCPHCGAFFIPRLKDVQPPRKDANAAEARRGAFLCCPVSGCVIDEACKTEMNARGVFVAPGQHITDSGEVAGDPPDNTIFSLWVSGLASPFVTWGERLEELMNARSEADPEKIQGAVNKAGECYAPVPLNAPTIEAVLARRCPYVMGEVPREVVRLVAGIDVQLRELFYTVRGFGSRGSSWLVTAGRLLGDTRGEEPWDALSDLLLDQYSGMSIKLALIDAGFRPDKPEAGDTHKVYDFVRRHAWLCKAARGRAVRTTPLTVSQHEVKPNGKAAPFSIDLCTLDTDYFKSLVSTRLATDNGRPGSLGLPSDVTMEYARHLISEAREIVAGKPKWTQTSKANHWLDCESMAAAAGYILNVQRIAPGVERKWDAQAPEPLAARETVPVMLTPRAEAPAPVPVAPPPHPKAVIAAKSLRDSLADRFAQSSDRFNTR